MNNPLSDQSINLFDQLLGQFQLQANNPDFDQIAAIVSQAKRELAMWNSMKAVPANPLVGEVLPPTNPDSTK